MDIDTPLCHVNIRSTYVKRTLGLFKASLWVTKTRPVSVVVKLAVTKNSWLLCLWWSKVFNRHRFGNEIFHCQAYNYRKFSITNCEMTKTPIMWQLNFFGHHMSLNLGCLIDDGLISTIYLATKFGLPSNKI